LKYILIIIIALYSAAIFADDFKSESDQYKKAIELLYKVAPELTAKQVSAQLSESKKLLLNSFEKYSRWKNEGEGLSLRAFHLGVVCWYLGEREQALVWFERSFHYFPFNGEALFNRILILNELGRTKEAEKESIRYDDFRK
jgi:tetratricopeptide (TPR) repeat protein